MQFGFVLYLQSDPVVYLMVPFYAGESLGTVQTLNPLNSYVSIFVVLSSYVTTTLSIFSRAKCTTPAHRTTLLHKYLMLAGA